MSGAVAAHASYNGSGTQGLAVTNKISDATSSDVVSVFWNDNDTSRQLLYGSSTMEVPTSGSGKNASWGGSQIFTVNNDIDCVGDMYLSVTIELDKPVAPLTSTVDTATFNSATEYNSWAVRNMDVATSAEATTLNEPFLFSAYVSAPGFDTVGNANVSAGQPTHFSHNVPSMMVGALGGVNSIYFSRNPDYDSSLGEFEWNLKLDSTGSAEAWYVAMDTQLSLTESGSSSLPELILAAVVSRFTAKEWTQLIRWYNDRDWYALGNAAALDSSGNPIGPNVMAMPTNHEHRTDTSITFEDAIEVRNRLVSIFSSSGPMNTPPISRLFDIDVVNQGPAKKIHWTNMFNSVPEDVDRSVPHAFTGTKEAFWATSNLTTKVKFPLANILKRIEFQVGTQIWQTLEYNDLLSINATELSEAAYNRLGLQTSGFVRSDGERESKSKPVWVPGAKYQAFIPLAMLTKSLGPQLENYTQHTEDGYLMAAAPHQNVKIKVHYAQFSDIFNTKGVTANQGWKSKYTTVNGVDRIGEFVTNSQKSWTPYATLSTKLYAKHMIMCNEEREQMKKMPNGIPKRLKMTQNVNMQFPAKIYPDQAMTVDLDHYSLYGSHLIISASFPGLDERSVPTLKYAELKLNSSSFSGQLDGTLLNGITNKSLGLYANQFNLDVAQLDSGIGYYVFPLASRAYGGSSIPLNRFDNIRLLLTFDTPDMTSGGVQISKGSVNVTCVGETTGLYKGGAASLAMY